MRPSSLVALSALALGLVGCGEDKSPPVDPATVGPRGALKSKEMQEKMQNYTPNGAPVPGTDKK